MRVSASLKAASVASVVPRRAAAHVLAAALSSSVFACGSDADETRFTAASVDRASPAPMAGGSALGVDDIVFRSERDQEGVGDLYVMAADGSNVRRLTEGGDFSVPAWAPDGQSIAFREVMGLDSAIGLVSSEGGEPVRLITGEDPQIWDRQLTWSGDDIIFSSRRVGADRLWAISRSGGQQRPLLEERESIRDVADVSRVDSRIVIGWNPGTTLSETDFAARQDLWLIDNLDDMEPENMTQGRTYAPTSPRWSPDGTRFVFHAYARLPDGSIEGLGGHADERAALPDNELFMIDVRTRELTRLTDNAEDDSMATWTADGAHLIYVSGTDDGDQDIWKVAVDGSSDPINLIDDDDEQRPDIMPNSFWGVASTR